MRGYERGAVDEYVTRISQESMALRRDLAESERRRELAEQHASATEQEIREARSGQQNSAAAAPEQGFGFRAEKLLRLAEHESADLRATAAREATALIEQARAQAEQHRHEAEQNLIARSAVLDQQAAQRAVELQDREQQIGDQLAAARSECDAMHHAARRAADQHRTEAEAEADTLRAQATHDAQRSREQAAQEVTRLTELQRTARAELGRLAELLSTELSSNAGPATPTADPATGR